MSQEKRILAHLKSGRTLTPLEALRLYGCLRLGARILDLRDKGHNIVTQMVEVGGKRVARYSLATKKAPKGF